MTLETPLTDLKGVGPALAGKLAQLRLKTVGDMLEYYPRRYDDYSTVTPIARLKPGAVTIQAEIKQAKGRYVRRGMHITEAVASDESGSVRLIWFNQPYRAGALKSGQSYYISGHFELSHQRLQIMNPSVELVSEFPVNTARIVPVYGQTKGLTTRQIRLIAREVMPLASQLAETLPEWLIKQERLLSYAEAVRSIHFPKTSEDLAAAKHRLGFEEVFRLALASLLNKQAIAGEQAPAIPFDEKVARQFVKELPFNLTNAQRKVVWQIYQDLQRTQPMNRLVEGDVGSGKTVVAAMAAIMVLHHQHQVALMAPTEILARQHADTIQKLLAPLGYGDKVGLLVGSMSAAQKKSAHQAILEGKLQFIVGTHALIQDKVDLRNLELVIIDEQHRFGVEQRKALMAKANPSDLHSSTMQDAGEQRTEPYMEYGEGVVQPATQQSAESAGSVASSAGGQAGAVQSLGGHVPHVLSLTATPIPRSLALTLYGDLDLSVLDEKPAGRQIIQTELTSPNSWAQLYKKLDQQIEQGRQMYVVTPLVSDSELSDAESAEQVFEKLSKGPFKHRRVGLLHGQMKSEDKQAVMQQFADHQLDILVATTVIEVGVDVPNASLMLIENADRFGLAQLHQLRGRIGRGQHQSYCYLMMSDSSAPTPRLRAMETTNDGFKLAELDLRLRGPGAIYGTLQHGALDLRVANLSDTQLIAAARAAAQTFIAKGENLLKYPELAANVQRLRAVTNLN